MLHVMHCNMGYICKCGGERKHTQFSSSEHSCGNLERKCFCVLHATKVVYHQHTEVLTTDLIVLVANTKYSFAVIFLKKGEGAVT